MIITFDPGVRSKFQIVHRWDVTAGNEIKNVFSQDVPRSPDSRGDREQGHRSVLQREPGQGPIRVGEPEEQLGKGKKLGRRSQ
ncbi:hypothetical protein DPMN_141349 [Dreissena polymorpha]|uniref:Uncharacterized protein n=1 Tax=Dreissena polymorpha TaxID=45954 RepID=A0A9D4GCH8_DREPO|nr:hypothetical protein DPMN_141349 [Dreissena polymorpha]